MERLKQVFWPSLATVVALLLEILAVVAAAVEQLLIATVALVVSLIASRILVGIFLLDVPVNRVDHEVIQALVILFDGKEPTFCRS